MGAETHYEHPNHFSVIKVLNIIVFRKYSVNIENLLSRTEECSSSKNKR